MDWTVDPCDNFFIICMFLASSLLSAMDWTVDPCDNFFKFACGTWNKQHPIPEDKPGASTFDVMAEKLQIILKGKLIIK